MMTEETFVLGQRVPKQVTAICDGTGPRTLVPTEHPTLEPTLQPTQVPDPDPTTAPTTTLAPTNAPTRTPTAQCVHDDIKREIARDSQSPPTLSKWSVQDPGTGEYYHVEVTMGCQDTATPTEEPTYSPTTAAPTLHPTEYPTEQPTESCMSLTVSGEGLGHLEIV